MLIGGQVEARAAVSLRRAFGELSAAGPGSASSALPELVSSKARPGKLPAFALGRMERLQARAGDIEGRHAIARQEAGVWLMLDVAERDCRLQYEEIGKLNLYLRDSVSSAEIPHSRPSQTVFRLPYLLYTAEDMRVVRIVARGELAGCDLLVRAYRQGIGVPHGPDAIVWACIQPSRPSGNQKEELRLNGRRNGIGWHGG
ncbi:hypothetical protein K466DRAFT_661515 [Polyporus arcularius HHB13444]|uniref:Uncharacterized protein n=1 Tax=Polyporus arcularius HHB13444 TaxID=1314778 RepID=A0A5C3PJK9_9APHY|nr:hypothetical protein K466DRAFT_661515 [Polyporus arcularius HHB13444]